MKTEEQIRAAINNMEQAFIGSLKIGETGAARSAKAILDVLFWIMDGPNSFQERMIDPFESDAREGRAQAK